MGMWPNNARGVARVWASHLGSGSVVARVWASHLGSGSVVARVWASHLGSGSVVARVWASHLGSGSVVARVWASHLGSGSVVARVWASHLGSGSVVARVWASHLGSGSVVARVWASHLGSGSVVATTLYSLSRGPGVESSCWRFEPWAISFTPRCLSSLTYINWVSIWQYTLIAAWPKACQKSRVDVVKKRFARGWSVKCFERSYRLDTALCKNIPFIILLINTCIFFRLSQRYGGITSITMNLNNRTYVTWMYGTTTHWKQF